MAVADRHFHFHANSLTAIFTSIMKDILVAIDLRTDTGKVLARATELAKALDAKVWLLHVAAPAPDFAGYEAGPQYIRDVRADELREERGQLEHLAAEFSAKGIPCQPLHIMGPTVATILAAAESRKADIIVMGTHGRRGLAKAFMGSTCDEVLRANRFTVLVVPTPLS